VPVDLAPFFAVGDLLYDGPWLAERAVGVEDFLESRADALHPVIRTVLARAGSVSGKDVFRGLHALEDARGRLGRTWHDVDVVLVPTAPTAPTVERLLADPLGANAVLGRYTNFVNLLDLAALAVPSEVSPRGIPVGVTFLAPAGGDGLLLGVGQAWEKVVAGAGAPRRGTRSPAGA
jgi:allophanate hydrolase